MGKRVVKNYPSPRLMETIGATNQKPQEAIGELVANCFDARCNKEKLHISIDMRNDRIIVMDDGKGMTSEILEKAVCIAEDMSKYLERGEETKGHFGMGFKTSCSTLGDFYEIYTRPYGENLEYHTSFDIKEYSTRPSGSDAWDITIEDGKPTASSPLGTATHGTAFVISRLKIKDGFPVSAVLEYMGNAFKGHIEGGDVITIIDDSGSRPATPKTYKFIKGTKAMIDERFGPRGKYHITGWVAIDSQVHNDGFYGFNIYRRGQLVLTHDKSWFSAHLMTSRIIGEVNMDFLDATFYKQGVQQSEDWRYVAIHMRDFLSGVVSASRNLSKNHNVDKPAEKKAIIGQLGKEYTIVDEEVDTSAPYHQDNDNDESKPSISINNTIKTIVSERSLILEDGDEIQITFVEKEQDGHDIGPYDYIPEIMQEPMELQVIVYKNHPLWLKKIDSEVRKIIATSDAIYRCLIEVYGVDSRKALKIRNEWVSQRTESMK
jgi:hypothetical protein